MKMNFAYNLLKQLRSKKDEGGFTLIELLVVIIIIGILAAIALPSFLNQANRARETEATNGVGALNRGQQAFYLEAVEYAPTMADLDVGVDPASENFVFGSNQYDDAFPADPQGEAIGAAAGGGAGTFTFEDATAQYAFIYAAGKEGIRSFAGINYVDSVNDKNVTGAVLCRENAGQAQTGGLNALPAVADPGAGNRDSETLCGALEAVN